MQFDTHAHLDDKRFKPDLKAMLDELLRDKIHVLVPGVEASAIAQVLDLVTPYQNLMMAVGIHPSAVNEADRFDELEQYLSHPKIVAIGEIGLDYYWVKDNKAAQQALFRRQLRLAKEHDLPVIIHDREAHEDVFNSLRAEDSFQSGVIMHAYSGSAEMALEYVKLGAYISLAGPVTFKNARVPKEVAQAVPLDALLVETDAPYLTPHPFRGKRNDPRLLRHIIAQIADLRGVSFQAVEEATFNNALRAFKL